MFIAEFVHVSVYTFHPLIIGYNFWITLYKGCFRPMFLKFMKDREGQKQQYQLKKLGPKMYQLKIINQNSCY